MVAKTPLWAECGEDAAASVTLTSTRSRTGANSCGTPKPAISQKEVAPPATARVARTPRVIRSPRRRRGVGAASALAAVVLADSGAGALVVAVAVIGVVPSSRGYSDISVHQC